MLGWDVLFSWLIRVWQSLSRGSGGTKPHKRLGKAYVMVDEGNVVGSGKAQGEGKGSSPSDGAMLYSSPHLNQ